MRQIICQIGPFTIYSYGLMFAIAVLVCAFFLSKDAAQKGISRETVFDLVFWVVLSGLIGARLFFVILNWKYFLQYPGEIINVQNGGLAFQGSLVFGTIAGLIYVKKNKLSLVTVIDLCAPYAALGQSIGRIGCFLNGCCFGKSVPWGIYFPVLKYRAYPTQLFDAIGLFVIFLFLKRMQKKSLLPGQIFVLYLVLASLLRFIVEFFRADHYHLFAGLSVYQWVCLGLIILAFYVNARLKSRA